MDAIINFINSQLSSIRVLDIIDVAVVAFVVYKLILLIKETRAEQLIKGIIALFVIAKVSGWLRLYTINWILENTMTLGMIAILIVFQPELRRLLEFIGRNNFFNKSILDIQDEDAKKVSSEIVTAMSSLSRQKIGALLVLERKTGLNEIVETGTKLDALISSELLINIFIPNTPLHDGAVIIKGDKIKAAACFLPLTDSKLVSKELGTRHRAALGISEKSDSLTIIVSEETGAISITENGEITRYIDEDTLREILLEFYKKVNAGFLAEWRTDNERK